jgi:hypothetical protein
MRNNMAIPYIKTANEMLRLTGSRNLCPTSAVPITSTVRQGKETFAFGFVIEGSGSDSLGISGDFGFSDLRNRSFSFKTSSTLGSFKFDGYCMEFTPQSYRSRYHPARKNKGPVGFHGFPVFSAMKKV